ncbi:hypothetical protein T11_110 [Trichinella zimbabwensis]|uniref:Uncharacterized protein n=1 Tax=Trichinella zimbabwensis TaxID=268475 RepID=A0A0V1HLE9_9BILA|nr:hypothetical protein T11_110 [Trichinella zimbabwensis]
MHSACDIRRRIRLSYLSSAPGTPVSSMVLSSSRPIVIVGGGEEAVSLVEPLPSLSGQSHHRPQSSRSPTPVSGFPSVVFSVPACQAVGVANAQMMLSRLAASDSRSISTFEPSVT